MFKPFSARVLPVAADSWRSGNARGDVDPSFYYARRPNTTARESSSRAVSMPRLIAGWGSSTR